MAAFSLLTVLEGLATAVERLPGLASGAAYVYEEQAPVAPYAILRPTTVPILGEAFGSGLLRLEVEVELVPGELIDAEAATTVYGWLSAGSGGLWAALRTDPTLGGVADDTVPGDVAEVGVVETSQGLRYAARVPVRVLVRRDA